MPRRRNTSTGVVVNVDDATAKRLGPEWEPADRKTTPKSPSKKRRTSATKSDDD